MRLLVDRLLGVRCEVCGHGTKAGVGAWEFDDGPLILCYWCAAAVLAEIKRRERGVSA